MTRTAVKIFLAALAVGVVAIPGRAQPVPSSASAAQVNPIKHIIVMIRENHSYDQMFGRFPGGAGTTVGALPNGRKVALARTPTRLWRDITHTVGAAQIAINHGRMNGFALITGAVQHGHAVAMSQYSASQIPGYWAYAQHFTLMDHFFAAVAGPSFPNHLVLVSGASQNVISNPATHWQGPWGCVAGKRATVAAYNQRSDRTYLANACFHTPNLGTALDGRGVSWKYFAPTPFTNQIWSSFASTPDPGTAAWKQHFAPYTSFVSTVRSGNLPAVTWLTAPQPYNDHPPYSICRSQNWLVEQINAVMRSPLWKSTAIVVTWDEYGGFYDHMRPPVTSDIGLGPRVPTMVISPYSRAHTVDHTLYNSASVVRFIENQFHLPPLSRAGAQAASIGNALDMQQRPLPPLVLQPQSCR